jgi:hypothetical protein
MNNTTNEKNNYLKYLKYKSKYRNLCKNKMIGGENGKYDKDITLQDIRTLKTKLVERKKHLKGFNSFIADIPFQEFHIDLLFLPDLKEEAIGGLLFILL